MKQLWWWNIWMKFIAKVRSFGASIFLHFPLYSFQSHSNNPWQIICSKIIIVDLPIFLVDLDEYDDAFKYFPRANVECEGFWRKIFKGACVIVFHGSTVVMSSVSLVICYYTKGHFDTNLVYHPHHEMWVKLKRFVNTVFNTILSISLPWDQSTLYGYACEITLYTVDSITYFFGYCLLLITFISLCKHHMAFFEFFQHKVKQLETIDKYYHHKLLCRIVYFHVTVKKWVFLKLISNSLLNFDLIIIFFR